MKQENRRQTTCSGKCIYYIIYTTKFMQLFELKRGKI